jgi:DnaK suppressor protein
MEQTAMTRKLDVNLFAQRLSARRAELLEELAQTRDSRSTVELDQTTVGRLSRMHAIQEQATALATGRQRECEIARIQAALQRMKDGEFGYCVMCGGEIDERRLQLDPSLPHCIDCARTSVR